MNDWCYYGRRQSPTTVIPARPESFFNLSCKNTTIKGRFRTSRNDRYRCYVDRLIMLVDNTTSLRDSTLVSCQDHTFREGHPFSQGFQKTFEVASINFQSSNVTPISEPAHNKTTFLLNSIIDK